uniref:cell division protein n=1 Tax=Tetradesmus dimorphus TaxID=119574 RepID=UPI0030037D2B|nr:cell division protein [Tetradesmus dimorphus]
MKQKKSFFNKFHRKYLFLQNSLSDFLHWRTSNSFYETDLSLLSNRKTKNKQKSGLLEQDKICLQEYWKSTENKKIKNAIQNLNNKLPFSSFKLKKTVHLSDFSRKKESKPLFRNSLNDVLSLKKNNGEKVSERKTVFLNSSSLAKESIYARCAQKKFLKKSIYEKKKYITFQKKLSKFKNLQDCNSKFETLIPESDCFRKVQPFPFFANQKIGQFFSKKTIFQQYWIFPLLGFVVLFSSTSSFFDFQKKTLNKNFIEQKIENYADSSFDESKSRHNILALNFFDSKKTNQIHGTNFENTKMLKFVRSVRKIIDFSYSDNSSKATYLQFKNLENNEFQEFCNFYLKFFEKSMPSFLIDEKENKIHARCAQKHLFVTSNFEFVPSMFQDVQHQQTNFRKRIETKRNVFNWKWFSCAARVNSQFLTVQQIHKFSNFFTLEIPQKAEFLFLNNEKNTKQEAQNGASNFIPALDFSRAAFLLNEFEKDFNGTFQAFTFQNDQSEHQKNQEFFFQNNSNFLNSNQKDFLNSLQKEDLPFLQSFFSKKTEMKDFENNSKNFFFLQKWLQTQNFWKIQRKDDLQKQFDFLSESIDSKMLSRALRMKIEKFKTFNKIPDKTLNFQNFMNLDSIYLQKVFQHFQLKNEFYARCAQNKDFTNITTFSNFSKFLQLTQTLKKSSARKIRFFTKEVNSALKFKKQTFEFFVFQYYNTIYKKYSTQVSFEKTPLFVSSFFSESSSKKPNFDANTVKNLKRKNFLNTILNNGLKNQLFEKTVFKNFHSSSPITELKLPIFLDFSNRKNFEDPFFSQKKKSVQNSENLETQSTNISSWYFHLGTNQKRVFKNFTRAAYEKFFKQVPKFSYFMASQDELNLSSKMFSRALRFFFALQKKIKMNSLKSTFYCSKNSFFEKIIENTLKNLKTNSFLKLSQFEFFKKSFLFEKIKKEQPFVFQNSRNFAIQNLSNGFPFQNSNRNFFFFKSSKSFILKQKQDFLFLNKFNGSPNTEIQKYKKNFSSFQSRKFEKVFKTFLSSLNKEKIESHFFQSNVQSEQNSLNHRLKAKAPFKFKLQNDSLVLETLSNSLKNKFKNLHLTFFVSSLQTKVQKKDSFHENSKKSFDSDFFLTQTKKFSKNEQSSKVEFESNRNKNKDLIRPTALLKRDGFVIVPKSELFSDLTLKKYIQDFSIQKKVKQNFYLSKIYEKEQNHLRFSRFEKEKALQKKRRMKKQKLETRRRKKRKRFFPRPVWLRFHLYKKFLKSRHPENLSTQKQELRAGIFLPKEQEVLTAQSKDFQIVSFAFPKIFKNQDFKDFSFSKTRQFCFSLNSMHGFFDIKKMQEKVIAQKRWKNVFVLFFLNNQNTLEKKWKKISNFSTVQKNTNLLQFSSEKKSLKNFDFCFDFTFFLQSKKKSSARKKQNQFNGSENKKYHEMKIFRKNRQKWGFYWKNGFQEKLFYKKFFFENNFTKKPNFFGGTETSPISQNREDYKISGEILSEFLRLSWKSYWFQMNFQPYTRRITQNFRKMQQIESKKNFSDFDIFSIFGNIKYPHLFSGFPTFQSNVQEYSQKDLLLKKALLKKFLWYCNIGNSFDSKSINDDSLIGQNQRSLNFQKMQNLQEYNRILYARVSEILKNFKSSETNDEYLTRQTQKNFKIPKRKNEVISSNSSFFTKSALFYEHFNVPSQPFIPAFSMFSSLFHDHSIKPTGELPTLRALWALHQTNFYHFQEKNPVRNLWTLQKRTDNLKSFKGTKKMVSYFRKYSGLEKFNAPKLLKAYVSHNFLNEEISKQIEQKHESPSFVFKPKKNFTFFLQSKKKSVAHQKNLDSKKILFLSTLKSGQTLDFIQQLDTMSLQKFRTVQEKCSIFGINTFKQNSKISFRYLKFHLFSQIQNQNFSDFLFSQSFEKTEQSQKIQKSSVFKNQELERLTNTKKPNPQNSAKSSLNFWWSQKNGKNFEFLFSSQNNCVNHYDFLPFLNFYQSQNFHFSMNQTNFPELSPTNQMFFPSEQNFQNFYGIRVQFLWFGAIVFHLALFFSLFKLPEIRSVFKFKLVLVYKFLNGFFGIVFSIYNLFKQYTTRGTYVVKKIIKFSNSSVYSRKSFVPCHFIGSNNQQFQNFSLLRNNWIKEKNFENLYLSSLFDLKLFKIFLKRKNEQNHFFFPSTDILQSKNSTSRFFDVFVRLSEFSFSSFSQKTFFKNVDKNQKVESFFVSQKKLFQQFSVFGDPTTGLMSQQKSSNQESLPLSFEKITKIFLFRIASFAQKNKKNFFLLKQRLSDQSFFRLSEKKFQILSKTEKLICQLALSFLLFGKSTTQMSYSLVRVSSVFSAKIFDLFEMIMFSIYKFLEKPAELMIEWIALIFLIEWSSDMATFIPDTFDIALTKSSQKFYRPIRSGSLIFSFLSLRYESFISPFSSNFGLVLPSTLFNSVAFFGSSNMLSFILQKRIFYFFEHFSSVFIQPDMDILIRQRKGMIFWDIWAEILLKAAEKYNVNIPSFVTLKEEQELFIERLLQDKQFLKNLQIEKYNFFLFTSKNKFENFNGEMLQQKSLASFVENFLIKDCPKVFSQFGLFFKMKNIDQLILSSQMLSPAPFGFNFPNSSYFKKELQIQPSLISDQDQRDLLFENFDRWSCHQYGTYQGPETDLFVDIHPPKSLKHIQFLKYYEPAQYTLGSLICQIYSGIFSKQVAKNILVIGAPGTAKTLFIQALAGETEMKIITDNAYRYSMVQRGVAVGMKYLRDVFDALVLQTPCFFLMEHIHVIGSKRPLLISDDENVKGMQASFGLDQQEVHETNQMIYQLNRHSISDYKRPYKGDFSMGIPTNFFIQNFYSKFEKNSTSIFKNSQFSTGGVNFVDRNSPISPLPIDSIENSLFHQGLAEKEKSDTAFQNSFRSETFKKGIFNFQSRLQMSKEQIFAPPATSPFTILMMKEQKKLKPKKIVQETSWGGLSTDQMISYQKENSSVRAKVAVLADITMNLSRGKLDMITDLLVIIDSVRSNRGFVVFATTHLPSLLDPALRRPGRFDETISLAQSPNFLNRFEILKKNLENSVTTLDFLDSSILTENFSELNLLNLITGTKLSLFHQYKYTSEIFENFSIFSAKFTNSCVLHTKKQQSVRSAHKIISQINPSKALQSFLKSSFFHDFYSQKQLASVSFQNKKKNNLSDIEFQKQKTDSIVFVRSARENDLSRKVLQFQDSKYFLRDFKLLKYTFLPKGPSHILSLASSKIGIFLAKANLLNDPTAFIPLSLDTNIISASFASQNKQFLGTAFYSSQEQQKLQLMVFLSGKISEFFIQKTTKKSGTVFPLNKQEKIVDLNTQTNKGDLFETPFELFNRKFSIFPRQKTQIILTKFKDHSSFDVATNQFYAPCAQNSQKQNRKIQLSLFKKAVNSSVFQKNNFFWTTFGNDQLWRSATPFVFAIIQKRFLFTKNLLLSKMLFFENKNQRKLPPSPPSSSILMPSKKYENLKRTETDFVQKGRFSINEKIQMHQQQRFLKQLYNIPVQQYFRSEGIQNRQTFFSSSFQELAYIDSLTRRTSSSHFYQRKYLGIRHRFSNVHQWWNGFLPEHNTETTYLSDVDWRTMFTSETTQQKEITSFKNSTQQTFLKGQKMEKQTLSSEKSFNQTFELTMDFPDAEQYYNPRNRRWYFHGKSLINNHKNVSYWFTFHMNLQYEIYYHYLMQSFHEMFQYFDKNREMFDYFIFHLLRKGFLKELDCLTTISRFK